MSEDCAGLPGKRPSKECLARSGGSVQEEMPVSERLSHVMCVELLSLPVWRAILLRVDQRIGCPLQPLRQVVLPSVMFGYARSSGSAFAKGKSVQNSSEQTASKTIFSRKPPCFLEEMKLARPSRPGAHFPPTS